jgi:hypothetical protein
MTAAKRPAATAITVSAKNSETTIEQGATVQLLVSAQTPFGALDDVTWASDKTADATIDANGLVTALATATVGDVVTFTATSKTTATVKNTYQLTITKKINYTAIASYDFSTTATAGTGVTDATTLKALFTSSASTATGFSNIVSATANLSNMYTGYSGYTKFGFKFGSGSGAGKFDATVSSAVAKVVITTVSWGATDTVSVGGDTAQTPGLKYSTATAGVDLTFTFTATTTVNFTYTKRGFISKIVFYAVAA